MKKWLPAMMHKQKTQSANLDMRGPKCSRSISYWLNNWSVMEVCDNVLFRLKCVVDVESIYKHYTYFITNVYEISRKQICRFFLHQFVMKVKPDYVHETLSLSTSASACEADKPTGIKELKQRSIIVHPITAVEEGASHP
jgi:hypothetical protein